MDYLYENLDENRFQEFCSTLIAKEFPDFQSFPIGQPDGGRDTLVYAMDARKKEFIVFQVKYVRNPKQLADVHKWLTGILKKEAPKIDKLIPKGAKKFYLMTNVDGTAHLDSGSKDKVNKILEENISIPSLCWWRDDISRLIEKNPLFKWSYPEILNGQDMLNSLLFENISEKREKRESVVKAYLADQYDRDSEVKFQQIELQNNLLSLFTDVPFRIKKFNEKNKNLKRIFESFDGKNRLIPHEDSYILEKNETLGAAEFLLHPRIQKNIKRILLEGGPGQGKSTISQYICQVHRIRLLNKNGDLSLLPEKIKETPIRLPFKIDLRHIAAWLEKENPYERDSSNERFFRNWEPSLESFLVGHIIYHSRIDDFHSSDLIALLRLSPVMFVFDGFDEIANLQIREDVINFINRGINRLSENAKSIQVIITSRPAAFSDTIGFSVDLYPHIELTNVTQPIIMKYVDNWIKASRLEPREGSDLKRLVQEKLQLAHLKELAKSPMQLAIFISLLRTRGESLPNKRTALYDSYIELFFNREAEKSVTIRDNRDLIIDIHQYLAWVLHSEAELFSNSGTIKIEELQKKLKAYLKKEGHETLIAEQLFHVMQERVCALVSRIQGTYEFEVQPLREYFCAKYLFKTSPHSPTGKEQTGSLPDRFDAISRNFYWNNVVRFFAGCFDKGHLPLLIYKLKELQEDNLLKYTNYPRLLTSQVLSDWVFTQYPRLLDSVIQIIVDGLNIGKIINQGIEASEDAVISLPIECGRKEIVEECFRQLKNFPHADYASELINILRNNKYETVEKWASFATELADQEKLTVWLDYAYRLGIIYKLKDELIMNLVSIEAEDHKSRRLQRIIQGNRLDTLLGNLEIKEQIFKFLLDGRIMLINRNSSPSSLSSLSTVIHTLLYSRVLNNDYYLDNISVNTFISERYINSNLKEKNDLLNFEKVDEMDKKVFLFLDETKEVLNQNLGSWRNSLSNWNILIESFRKHFGETKLIQSLATVAAGIKSRNETYEEFSDLNNSSLELAKRVRCARMKSGNLNYWKHHINHSEQLDFTLLIYFTWATPKVLARLNKDVEEKIASLEQPDLRNLYKTLDIINNRLKKQAKVQKEIKENFGHTDSTDNILLLISRRLDEDNQNKFIFDNIKKSNSDMVKLDQLRLDFLIKKFLATPDDDEILLKIEREYKQVTEVKTNNLLYYQHFIYAENKIPLASAQKIMENPIAYPRLLSSMAEKTCRSFANKNAVKVGQVAIDEKWFEVENTFNF